VVAAAISPVASILELGMNYHKNAPVVLTREQLYEQVWTTSVFQLAKAYGISDVGLAKVCKRHQVPRPPLGYWAKKAVGKAPARPPLPIITDPALQTITISPQPPRPQRSVPPGDLPASPETPPAITDPALIAAYEQVRNRLAKATVPATLRSPLPVVAETLAGLRRAAKETRYPSRAETANLFHPYRNDAGDASLGAMVGRESFERCARFFDALLKACQLCGFRTEATREGYRSSVVLVAFGEKFGLRLRELTRREPHTPTPKELADKQKYPHSTRIPKWDYFPCGTFSLTLTSDTGRTDFGSWTDGKARRVEDMIPEIVRGIFEASDRARARKRQEEEESRRQAREAIRRYEEEQRRKEEQARVDTLVREVERWELSRRIRRYRRTVERAMSERMGRIDADSETGTWLRWVDSVIDRFDSPSRRIERLAREPAPQGPPVPESQ
jgi:hypothetical protein